MKKRGGCTRSLTKITGGELRDRACKSEIIAPRSFVCVTDVPPVVGDGQWAIRWSGVPCQYWYCRVCYRVARRREREREAESAGVVAALLG